MDRLRRGAQLLVQIGFLTEEAKAPYSLLACHFDNSVAHSLALKDMKYIIFFTGFS
jgi:hypothetical protein